MGNCLGRRTSADMDDLPIEVLLHVMDFLPLKSVFGVMRVSKKFELGSRIIVKTWKGLSLGSRGDGLSLPTYALADVVSCDIPERLESQVDMERSLLQMKNLKRLYVAPHTRPQFSNITINMMIENNAETLEVVHLPASEPFSMPRKPLPKLRDLQIHQTTAERVQGYPMLTSYGVRCLNILDRSELFLLPVKLTSLSLGGFDFFWDTSAAISHLVNLRHIQLTINYGPGDVQELMQCMQPFLHLTSIGLVNENWSNPIQAYAVLLEIVKRYPNLTTLKLPNVDWDDESMDFLCRFRHLQHLVIGVNDNDSRWTNDDLRVFLTNGPIATLRTVAVNVKYWNGAQEIVDEVKRQTGSILTFDYVVEPDPFRF